MEKEYVLVSQGVEIYRTKDKKEAEKIRDESNEDWLKYYENSLDRGERPADNRVYMYKE